jgi:hypothetical protein
MTATRPIPRLNQQVTVRLQVIKRDLRQRREAAGLTLSQASRLCSNYPTFAKPLEDPTSHPFRGPRLNKWLKQHYAIAMYQGGSTAPLTSEQQAVFQTALSGLLVHLREFVRQGRVHRALTGVDFARAAGMTHQNVHNVAYGAHGQLPSVVFLIKTDLLFSHVEEIEMEPLHRARCLAGLSATTLAGALSACSSRKLQAHERGKKALPETQRIAATRAIERLRKERRVGLEFMPRLSRFFLERLEQPLRLMAGDLCVDFLLDALTLQEVKRTT